VTLIVPFYRNVGMLRRQIDEWHRYPSQIRIIVVDDGSPEPARPVLDAGLGDSPLRSRVRLYRITVDIPWNREGARNLASSECNTDWLMHVDIDHVLPAPAAAALLEAKVSPVCWYRFPRFRVGRADETRKKDAIPDDAEFGEIHPHIDSYLVTREMYFRAGGYDEDFAGVLGGGSEFLRRLDAKAALDLLPPPICLHVYTRDKIPDASDWSLSRDREPGKRLAREKASARKSRKPIEPGSRFPWIREL